jgi:XapX domain-containing protein
MRSYVLPLTGSIPVGLIYACLQVRSHARPSAALLVRLGILIGTHACPVFKRRTVREPVMAELLWTEWAMRITSVFAEACVDDRDAGNAPGPRERIA